MLRSGLLAKVSERDGLTAFVFVLIAYALFSVLDWMTTAMALASGGHEGNPLAASLYAHYGAMGLLAFKGIVVAVIIAVLVYVPRRIMSQRVALWVGAVFATAVAVIVIHNLHALTVLHHAIPHPPMSTDQLLM